MKTANAIGENLATVNFQYGLAISDYFDTVSDESIKDFPDGYNDGLNESGTVVFKTGKKGDYYGVLRGASNVEVPGMIIEHGYHSVKEVRAAVSEGEIIEAWANADAEGIAYGFGFAEWKHFNKKKKLRKSWKNVEKPLIFLGFSGTLIM